jgi:DNA replication protein DnaC
MSERKPEVLLKHYLKKLKLPTILREYQSMAAVCMKDRCERLTGALLDRLTHRVHIIEANGESYRLQESKRRIRGKRNSDAKQPDQPQDGKAADSE